MVHDSDALEIVVDAPGGASVMSLRRNPLRPPGEGEVVLRQQAVGLNFHDVYVRSGAYRTMPYPGTPGIEAAGVVEQVGPGVAQFRSGDRVAYISAKYGAYADRRVISAAELIALPDSITTATAAASLLKGVTAHMLLKRMVPLHAGDTVLLYAAAGGVGQLVIQMAAAMGLRVLGVVGNEGKASLARSLGCEQVALRDRDNVLEMVSAATEGRGVKIVLDGIGADTLDTSLAALSYFGHCCLFGQVSGSSRPIEVAKLAERSLSVSRPIVFHHVADRPSYLASVQSLFSLVSSGAVRVSEPRTFTLAQLPQAHAALESGETTGSLIIAPEPGPTDN